MVEIRAWMDRFVANQPDIVHFSAAMRTKFEEALAFRVGMRRKYPGATEIAIDNRTALRKIRAASAQLGWRQLGALLP